VGVGGEAGIATELARSPLPHAADHPQGTARCGSLGERSARQRRKDAGLDQFRQPRLGARIAPRVGELARARRIPSGCELPLWLRRQPQPVRASECLGLKERDVDHGRRAIERVQAVEAPLTLALAPLERALDLLLAAPRPAFRRPPLAAAVAAAVDEA